MGQFHCVLPVDFSSVYDLSALEVLVNVKLW